MMDFFIAIFGQEFEVSALQMVCRAVVVFVIALLLIRIAGRRSFSIHAAIDNIIAILLGSVLSRAIVGTSPFIPTISACFAIVILYRIIGLIALVYPRIEYLTKGVKIPLYQNGKLIKKNLRRGLVSEEDVMSQLRLHAQMDNFDDVKAIYMERNGHISVIKNGVEK